MRSRHSTYLNPKVLLLITLLILMALVAGLYLGRSHALTTIANDPLTTANLLSEINELREQIDSAQKKLEVQRTREEVAVGALEMLRREMAEQREQVVELEHSLRFYRGLMAKGDVEDGLSLRLPEIVPGSEEGQYAFRFVLQQQARKHKLVTGELAVNVDGVRLGEEVSYDLVDLSTQLTMQAVPLSFRYFQAVDGELILPEGFEPRGISVAVHIEKPQSAELQEVFPWRVQERFSHVAQ